MSLPALTGNFNGENFVTDPATGFLTKSNHAVESGPGVRSEKGFYLPGHGVVSELVFDAPKKLELIRALENSWPNVTAACHAIGISKQTYYNHMAIDEKFREAVNELKERMIDKIENVRMKVAEMPSGSFDRMCVLNAYRSEVYNPKVKIEVEHTVTRQEGERRLNDLSLVIDAEIVDTVRKIKAQRVKGRRPQNPNGPMI